MLLRGLECDKMNWQDGEKLLVKRLDELGYGECIAHWSELNQYADGDVILRIAGAFITFDTKTSLESRADGNVTVNVPTYRRAKEAYRRGQSIMVYNARNDKVAPIVLLVEQTFQRGVDRPLHSKTFGPDYYVGEGSWFGWRPLEVYLRDGFCD